MKKFMLCALLLGAFTFSACGSDDDNSESLTGCQTCTAADMTTTEYCLKEDGSIVTIFNDQEQPAQGAEGVTFAQFIAGVESSFGLTCVASSN